MLGDSRRARTRTRCRRPAALALLLPPDDAAAEEPDELLDLLDGLILAGGARRRPGHLRRPARTPRPTAPGPSATASSWRWRTARSSATCPLLGICRGMQLLNVACGGTLEQHLPDTVGHERHRHTPGTFGDHEVRLEPGSLAARAAGAERDRA